MLKVCCSLRDEDTLTTLPLLGTLDVLPHSLCHRCLQYVPETTRRVWLFSWGFFAKRTMRKNTLHGVVVCMRTLCPTATFTTTTPSATESEMSEQLDCCCNAHSPEKCRPTRILCIKSDFDARLGDSYYGWLKGLQFKHDDLMQNYGIECTNLGCGLDMWDKNAKSSICLTILTSYQFGAVISGVFFSFSREIFTILFSRWPELHAPPDLT